MNQNQMLKIGLLFLISAFFVMPASAYLTNIEVCDQGLNLETIQICFKDSYAEEKTVVVDSISKLIRNNDQPYYDAFEKVTFIYQQPASGNIKEVDIIHTVDLAITQTFNYTPFSSNFVNGQSLMLKLDNEFYLLSYDNTQPMFSPSYLQLSHVPTLRQYQINPYKGTNSYFFTVLGDKQIVLTQSDDGKTMIIGTSEPGESPAAYVIPYNLAELYEVSFDYDNPVRILSNVESTVSAGTFTVCQDDNPRDAQQIKVCRDNNLAFTLQLNNLTKKNAGTNDFLFLYEIANNKKQVTVFYLQNIDAYDPLEEVPFYLDYDIFIDNAVAGRRLGFEFQNNLYLLSHPVTQFISLPSLNLTAYTSEGRTILTALGSESEVEFSTIDGGKMFIRRNYGSPPPPFDLWALEEQELTPINLDNTLFTSLSSLGSIIFIAPDLGTVRVRTDDIKFSAPLFKLSSTTYGDLDLELDVPYPLDIALLYYHTANIDQGLPVKTAAIYRYYDLNDEETDSHAYTDDFIATITSGKELALRFGDSYYRLGHTNQPNMPAFFNTASLTLKTLDGQTTFTVQPLSVTEVKFTIPEGEIKVTIDDTNKLMLFEPVTKSTLEAATIEVGNYSAVLTATNTVRIGTTILGLCNQELYRYVPAADVCLKTTATEELLVDQPVNKVINGEKFMLETNGLMGDQKTVTVRRVLTIPYATTFLFADWNEFISHLINDDVPIFLVHGQWYVPVAEDNLLTNFILESYLTEEQAELRDDYELGPLIFNGTYVLNDSLVNVRQSVIGPANNKKIQTQFQFRSYYYLPEDGTTIPLTDKESDLTFASSSSGQAYTLELFEIVPAVTPSLVRLKLTDALGTTIFNRYFAKDGARELYLDNVLTEIKVTGIAAGEANITVQRIVD